jgi:hypothetical protein
MREYWFQPSPCGSSVFATISFGIFLKYKSRVRAVLTDGTARGSISRHRAGLISEPRGLLLNLRHRQPSGRVMSEKSAHYFYFWLFSSEIEKSIGRSAPHSYPRCRTSCLNARFSVGLAVTKTACSYSFSFQLGCAIVFFVHAAARCGPEQVA